jgi:hypothetical protein
VPVVQARRVDLQSGISLVHWVEQVVRCCSEIAEILDALVMLDPLLEPEIALGYQSANTWILAVQVPLFGMQSVQLETL